MAGSTSCVPGHTQGCCRGFNVVMGIFLVCAFIVILVCLLVFVKYKDKGDEKGEKIATVAAKTTTRSIITTTTLPATTTTMPIITTTTLQTTTTMMSLDDVVLGTPPEIVSLRPSGHYVYRADESITLTCQAKGAPDPSYSWYKDGQSIFTNAPNLHVYPNDGGLLLQIDPMTSLDEGSYSCVANNTFGTVMSENVYLQRAVLSGYPAGFPAKHYSVEKGKGLAMSCLPTKSVPEGAHFWVLRKDRFSGADINIPMDERIHMNLDGDLVFSYVEKNDEQNGDLYSCGTFNPYLDISIHGSDSTVTVTDNQDPDPKYSPSMTSTINEVGTVIGDTAQLECIFYGRPAPAVTWYKEGKALEQGQQYTMTLETRVVIYSVEPGDEGTYTCTATNSEGTLSYNITLSIEKKPVFRSLEDEPGRYIVEVGAEVTFPCTADAIPPAEVTWFMNAEPLSVSEDRYKLGDNGKKLSFTVTSSDQSAVVQCNASNIHGYTLGTGYITIVPSKKAFLLKALGDPNLTIDVESYTNWDQTAQRSRVFTIAPSTLEEIQKVVGMMDYLSLRGRCVGSAYSYSDLLPSEGTVLIEMGNLRTRFDGDPIHIDRDNMLVTAAAGLTIKDLVDFCVNNDVQIVHFPTVYNPQLGGVFSTGTSSGYLSSGSMADYIVGMRVVDVNGTLRTYTEQDHPDQMAALRLCVGMCGVIYDVTFKVTPLRVTKVSNRFYSLSELLRSTWIAHQLSTGGMLWHWAPLSSLTAKHWQDYALTGRVPEDYDPSNDKVWVRLYEDTPNGTKPDADRRERRSAPIEPAQSEPQAKTPLLIHKVVYETMRKSFDSQTDLKLYHPYALAYLDGETLPKAYNMQFVVEDVEDFSNSLAAIQVTLQNLKALAQKNQMPVTSIIYSWSGLSEHCYLCPETPSRQDTTHVIKMEMIGASWSLGYFEYLNTVLSGLKDSGLSVRVAWHQFYDLHGIQDFIKTSLGDNLESFKKTLANEKLDPDFLFTNDYLRGIFTD